MKMRHGAKLRSARWPNLTLLRVAGNSAIYTLTTLLVVGSLSSGSWAVKDTAGVLMISRGQRAYLADPKTLARTKFQTFIPPGTLTQTLRLQNPNAMSQSNNGFRLVHSAQGFYAYIQSNSRTALDANDIKRLKTSAGTIAFFAQRFSVKKSTSKRGELVFTPGEFVEVYDYSFSPYEVGVDLCAKLVMECPDGAQVLKFQVPSYYMTILPLDMIDFAGSNEVAGKLKFPSPLQPFVADEVAGITKSCDSTRTQALQAGAKGGLNLPLYFTTIKLDFGAEVKYIENFGVGKSVERRYFWRGEQGDGRLDVWRLTSISPDSPFDLDRS